MTDSIDTTPDICPYCGETDCGLTCMAYILDHESEPGEDPLLVAAESSAEAHLESIREDVTSEWYAAELERLTASEYARLLENEFRPEDEEGE